jgi:hypothetical protein
MPLLKRIIARLIGFDGAYHRFKGKVTVEKFERGVSVERFGDRAIWLFRQGATSERRDLKFLLSCECSGQSPLRVLVV